MQCLQSKSPLHQSGMSFQMLAQVLLLFVWLQSCVSNGLSEILDIPFTLNEFNLTAVSNKLYKKRCLITFFASQDGVKLCTTRRIDFEPNSSYFIGELLLLPSIYLFFQEKQSAWSHTSVLWWITMSCSGHVRDRQSMWPMSGTVELSPVARCSSRS